jgi:predicted DCC family thiol-disulfide oxidoreductase YuxK
VRALSRFLSADLRSLALLRVYLGVVLIGDLLLRLGEVESLYSNDGVLSNHFSLYRPLSPHQFSLYVTFSSARDVTVAFLATLVVYVLFLVGYRTRLFQALSFICVTSLHARNLMAELPSDVPLHLWMAWSLFLPLGARFSLDSMRRSLATRRERSPEDLNLREPAPQGVTSIAVLGMLLQLAVMHFFTGLHQGGPSWRDGTALYYALHQATGVTDWGASVVGHVSPEGLKTASAAYRNSEMLLGALVLVPFVLARRATIVALVIFHVLCRALFDWGPYDAVMLVGVPLLVSSEDWAWAERWYQARKRPLTVYFDADCGVCLMICRLLVRFDVLSRLSFQAGQSESAPNEVRAVSMETAVAVNEKTGEIFTKSRAFGAIVGSLPLGAPFAWILRRAAVARLLDRVYEVVARNRAAISVWLGYEACGVSRVKAASPLGVLTGTPLGRVTAVLRECGAALFLVVCGVALARGSEDEPRGPAMASVLGYPRIFQLHDHLSPDPPKRTGTVVVDGQTAAGVRFDPLTGLPPALELGVPTGSQRPRLNPLMRAYYASVSRPNHAIYLPGFRDYVAKLADRRPAGDKLVSFTIDWIETAIPPPPGAMEAPADGVEALVPRRKLISRP